MKTTTHKAADRSRWNVWWIVAAPLLVVCAGLIYEAYLAQRAEQDLRLRTVSALSTLRAQLEGALNSNISLAQGLVAVVATKPDIDQNEFVDLARELFRQPSEMRNIALARDMVISHVYPVEANRASLGLNYMTHPQQREAAIRVRESGKIVVAGPVNLVQGGVGLIARAPVFVRDPATGQAGRFWGLIAAVIDTKALYRAAGLVNVGANLQVALRGKDGSGDIGDVFFGDPEVFKQQPVSQTISLPLGTWRIAAIPSGGWQVDHPDVWQLRTATVVFAAMALVFAAFWRRYLKERRESELRLLQAQAKLLAALEQSPAGIILADAPGGEIRVVNSAALKIRGLAEEEICGKSYIELGRLVPTYHLDGRVFDDDELPLSRAIHHGESPRNMELLLHKGTPNERWVLANSGPVRDDAGEIIGGVVVFSDVTDVKRTEEQIRQRAYYDSLTALPNRVLFLEVLEKAIKRNNRQGKILALMYIDLDRFKIVNDTLGHDVGDLLLHEAAGRIRELIRGSDTVARLGGDEFTVILPELTHPDNATVIAEKLIRKLAEPYQLMGHEVYSGASIGITFSPGDGLAPSTLLKNADMAMYQAKDQGRNAFQCFSAEMTERAESFVAVEKDLRRALERGELRMEYQPIFQVTARKVAGVEALVRWEHPELGMVGPDKFIPVAEETGLIHRLGIWVLRTACRENMELGAALGRDPLRLAVNVSSRQFRLGFDAALVARILEETGYPADRLALEITESLLVEEDNRVHQTLVELREMGVALSVDDFGTGYSSLGYLRRFPVSVLKVDRSFMRELGHNPRDTNLVEAIVAIARSLQMRVVAEGVETEDQLAQLAHIGCEYAQGFLLGRPVAVAVLAESLNDSDLVD